MTDGFKEGHPYIGGGGARILYYQHSKSGWDVFKRRSGLGIVWVFVDHEKVGDLDLREYV